MALEKLGASLDTQRFSRVEVNKYVSTPEQLLALRICRELDDEAHKTLYLHLCKYTQAAIIEDAMSFVKDARARDKRKLFSWRVKQLRAAWKNAGKNPDRQPPVKKNAVKKAKKPPVPEQLALF